MLMGNSTSSASSMWLDLQLKRDLIFFFLSARHGQVIYFLFLTLNFHWVSLKTSIFHNLGSWMVFARLFLIVKRI